ncbi:MAG: glycoside hydrolase family 88 protein [Prevotella sp.]|nr:glycoside hydrolase family 88 protein [Prevotella sp.]
MKSTTKQLLLMTLLVMTGVTNAIAGTNISLRFDDVSTGSKSTDFTVGDFSIYATTGNPVTILSSSQTINGVSFTRCLNLSGVRAAASRLIVFSVTGNCTIRTYGCSAGSSSSSSRHLIISSGKSPLGSQLESNYCESSSNSDFVCRDYTYVGEATNIYIGSYNSGYNIYGIDVIYSDGDNGEGGNSGETTPETPTYPAAGSAMTFDATKRYSEWVINSRLNDFYGNTTKTGFGLYDDEGNQTEVANNSKSVLDYVPGLVAKAILEAVDYYKDNDAVNVNPWYYAIQNYGNTFDISSNGKNGKSFDDLNAVKLYLKLQEMANSGKFADSPSYTTEQTVTTSNTRLAAALAGIKSANTTYSIKETTLPGAAGGWWHKSGYTNQMWCDGQYMGPALLAQMLNEYDNYESDGYIAGSKEADWDLVTKQFTISWNYLWNPEVKLLYHAFTADPECTADTISKTNASKWAGFPNSNGIYHSAEYWGRAEGWYFLALVDVLEQMQIAGLTKTENYKTLHGYLNELAAGIAAKQDAATGCWYQLLNHDGSFVAQTYDSSYSYTSSPVANYLESSATAIFTAAYLKGMRLGLYDTNYTAIAKKAYQGIVEQFMVADGNGGVHLVCCSKSAGVGGSNFRDGSAEYYLMGKDTAPTVKDPTSSSFYTEGKVLGGFILAATEYERLFLDKKLELTEAGEYTGFAAGEYDKVTLTRSFPTDQWTTMVVPFSASAEQVQTAFGNGTEIATVNRLTNDELYFTKQNAITANEPVLIKVATVNSDNTYTFNNVTVENNATPIQSGNGAQLIGTYALLTGGQSGDLGATDYFIYNNQFYDCTYMGRMKPFRAYITLTTAGAKLTSFSFTDDEDITAVNTVCMEPASSTPSLVYNVAGQRINNNAAHGLIIRKGIKETK